MKTKKTNIYLMAFLLTIAGCSSVPKEKQLLSSNNIKYQPVEIVDKAQSQPKIDANTYYSAGLLLEQQGKFKEAIEKYTLAINEDHTLIDAYTRVALLSAKLGRYKEAESILKEAISINPSTPALHNNLGFVYLFQKQYKFAEAEFRNALTLDPHYSRAKTNLAIALVYQDRLEEALSIFLTVCSPEQANYNIARILHSRGKLALAEKYYNSALKCNPDFKPAKSAIQTIKQVSQIKLTSAAD